MHINTYFGLYYYNGSERDPGCCSDVIFTSSHQVIEDLLMNYRLCVDHSWLWDIFIEHHNNGNALDLYKSWKHSVTLGNFLQQILDYYFPNADIKDLLD